jgi:very-short-patch-repair endonuclease
MGDAILSPVFNCANCNIAFTVRKLCGRTVAKFCSRACWRAWQSKNKKRRRGALRRRHVNAPIVTRTCESCGRTFEWNTGDGSVGRFCSTACVHNRVKAKPPRVTCVVCGIGFNRTDRPAKYCSRKCMGLGQRGRTGELNGTWVGPSKTKPCEVCGKIVERRPSKINRCRTCSPKCRQVLAIKGNARISGLERKMSAAFAEARLHAVAQYVIGYYVVDFAFPDDQLVVECDGKYWHALPKQQRIDHSKDSYLRNRGWSMLRLSEDEINASPVDCAGRVLAALQMKKSTPLFYALVGREAALGKTSPIADLV